ncbi:hypothetical protein ASPWEDRAFT_68366 [Aspergillus wentii DTO 134E9]|uniref:Uncharacterized protein n=1 Tax=Aspergillus wentii DTO 134E9 TaxID=1073089 RepID=A0A1L9RJA1_ASPWE|nr:uncharacterized protein ASPWEDRAFT_68366 [Aspergillus wentii DTO 134E9]OJJ34927.1 hypothetical protein ASPWEDRAFT_68366 [Aspergillus wentii DTO 134E9]
MRKCMCHEGRWRFMTPRQGQKIGWTLLLLTFREKYIDRVFAKREDEYQGYRKMLIIIDSEDWEADGILFVEFDLRKKDCLGEPLPEVFVKRYTGSMASRWVGSTDQHTNGIVGTSSECGDTSARNHVSLEGKRYARRGNTGSNSAVESRAMDVIQRHCKQI